MPSPPHRGHLDRLDEVDRLLSEIDLSGAPDKRAIRLAQIKLRNALLELHEARRLIERTGEETKTDPPNPKRESVTP